MAEDKMDPMRTIEQLVSATNSHDVEAIAACFAEDYTLDSPLHPTRSFRGKEQVRRNWTQIFSMVGDLEARLLAFARDGQTAWTEWDMSGTRRDGARHCMRGVFVFRVENGLIVNGRMFLEPVDTSSADASDGPRQVLGAQPGSETTRRAP